MRITAPLIVIAATSALAVSGCSLSLGGPWLKESDLDGEIATAPRDLTDFTSVDMQGNADLVITEGAAFSVTVTADTALQEHISTKIVDGTLVVGQDYKMLGSEQPVTVSVTLPELDEVSISGWAEASLQVDADSLTIDITGSGDVVATGSADELTIDVSGSGDVDASGLATRVASVDITGSGEVSLDVSESLTADITGSGDITYRGNPKVTTDITGSGDVRAVRD